MKKNESGRSMVEMLGVLAIIGVLSIGGIAGYTLSMRRHRANGVADTVSKYALVAYGHCQQLLLNGDVTGTSSCTTAKGITTFANAGIGSTPAGVAAENGIVLNKIESDATTGIDTVKIDVTFSDQNLCQALASITGGTCGTGNKVTVSIKQN